jgi:hypothetical protein
MMMPFEERWWDVALKLCHDTAGLDYTQIEKREGTLAWRIACALQKAYDISIQETVGAVLT